MSRKAAYINEVATGERTVEEKPVELHELDKTDVQDDILQPTSATVTLLNGEEIELPLEFSIKDIYKNKVMNSVGYVYFLLRSEIKNVRGEKEIQGSDPLITAILFKNSVQEAFYDMLGTVTKKPPAYFDGQLDGPATQAVFSWVLKILTGPKSNGEPQPKN